MKGTKSNGPTLLIMAAGMGSRYGGLKQIDPIGSNGELIADFSICDAIRAGFSNVLFVIKEDMHDTFEEIIGKRVRKSIPVDYVYQRIDDLPKGFSVPEGRSKPWGTAHAVMSARKDIHGPFAVINADDFYGREAFERIGAFLMNAEDSEKYQYAMVGYQLGNTLTENGSVSRGICRTENGMLKGITERTDIKGKNGRAVFIQGDAIGELALSTIVSLNMWGFTESFLIECEKRFGSFLAQNILKQPLKCEYFLPSVVNELIVESKAEITVLKTDAKWYGITYKNDRPILVDAIRKLIEDGEYN